MTPTPETDAEADSPRNIDLDDLRAGTETQVVPAEFARRLERERDDLRAELKKRECWVATWKGTAGMNYDLYKSAIREVHALRAENQRLAKVLADLQAIQDLDC